MAIVRIRRAAHGKDYGRVNEVGGYKNNPPKGLIVHTAGEVDGEFQVIDIWESLEDAERFEQEESVPLIKQEHGEDYQIPEPKTYEMVDIIRGR